MTRFHHAYNGIPTVDSSQAVGFDADAFGYRSLDHIARDRLSGSIDVDIKTMTPTLPGFKTRDGAIAVPSRSGNPDGATSIQDALIPSTALKGMLSSAYEAVTMSRLRLFDKTHSRTFSHRPPARKAQSTYPAFLTTDGESWELVFTFKKQPGTLKREFWTGKRSPQAVGLIDSTVGEDGYPDVAQLRHELPHLATVQYNTSTNKIQRNATRIIATAIRYNDENDQSKIIKLARETANTQYFPKRGFVVRTRSDDHTISESERKRYEFIFPFVEKGSEKEAYRLQVDQTIIGQFLSTLHDYAQNTLDEAQRLGYTSHANSLDKRIAAGQTAASNSPRLIHNYLSPQLLTGKPFERIDITDDAIESYLKTHLNEVHDKNVPGIPVFVSIDVNKDDGTWKLASIKISPVGRVIGKDSVSAYKLAQDQDRDPANSLDSASPGDTLWGFVPQSPSSVQPATGGLSGRVFIEPAHFIGPQSTSSDSRSPLLKVHQPDYLITLASPKPRTGVPYLRTPDGHGLECKIPGSTSKNPVPRDRTFITGQTLIRKVYPTHQMLITGKSRLPRSARDANIASKVASWIEPNAVFHCHIHFTNLSNEELAILLWLLKPKRLTHKGRHISEGYHHLGFGKPLGMGTVRVEATSCTLISGSELAEHYSSLTGVVGHLEKKETNNSAQSYRILNFDSYLDSNLPKKFKDSFVVKCFRIQACGWNEKNPRDVTYPAAGLDSPHSSSPADNPTLKWFQKREDNRVNLASLYSEDDPDPQKVEDLESTFGQYMFPGLEE